MPTIIIADRSFPVDDQGFLKTPDVWDDEVACLFAREQGITSLTGDHWEVIRFIRNYYLKQGQAPMIRLLCKSTGFNLRKLYQLFPEGPAQGACKIAGLAKPDGCV